MDTDDIQSRRRQKLRTLIEEVYDGKAVRLLSSCDEINTSYISQLLGGSRPFGEKAARKLERQLKLPIFYFDGLAEENLADLTPQEILAAIEAALPQMSNADRINLIKLCSAYF